MGEKGILSNQYEKINVPMDANKEVPRGEIDKFDFAVCILAPNAQTSVAAFLCSATRFCRSVQISVKKISHGTECI